MLLAREFSSVRPRYRAAGTLADAHRMALRRSTGCGARSHLFRRILAWRADTRYWKRSTPRPAASAGRSRLPLPGRRFRTLRHWVVTCSLHPSRRRSPGCSPWSPLQGSLSGSRRSGSPRSPLPPSMPMRSTWPDGVSAILVIGRRMTRPAPFSRSTSARAASAGAFLHRTLRDRVGRGGRRLCPE